MNSDGEISIYADWDGPGVDMQSQHCITGIVKPAGNQIPYAPVIATYLLFAKKAVLLHINISSKLY
jgi:hypothetical protein